MGFDITQVISDDSHYSPFVCTVCQSLVSLDALVTSCSHPFCRTCLDGWATQCGQDEKDCFCPACQENLSVDLSALDATITSAASIQLGGMHVAAQSLETAQPLAYAVLKQVQVACIHFSSQCAWSGDYANFRVHASRHGEETASNPFLERTELLTPRMQGPAKPKRPTLLDAGKLKSFKSALQRPPRGTSCLSTDHVVPDTTVAGTQNAPPSFPPESKEPTLPNAVIAGKLKDLMSALREAPRFPQKSKRPTLLDAGKLKSLMSALRENSRTASNGCISTDPDLPKTAIIGTRDASPLWVKRTNSEDGYNKVKVSPTKDSYPGLDRAKTPSPVKTRSMPSTAGTNSTDQGRRNSADKEQKRGAQSSHGKRISRRNSVDSADHERPINVGKSDKSRSMRNVVGTDSSGQGRSYDGDSADKEQRRGSQSSHARRLSRRKSELDSTDHEQPITVVKPEKNFSMPSEGDSADKEQRRGSQSSQARKFSRRKSELDSTEHEQPISLKSLKSTLPEPPPLPKTTMARPRDTSPLWVKRSKSDDVSTKVKVTPVTRHRRKHSLSEDSEDLECSYSQALDWNAPISDIDDAPNDSATSMPALMEAEEESKEKAFELQMEPEDDADEEEEEIDAVRNKQLVLERRDCEKLRKQANGKFNKGEFKASRLLYAEAIDIMECFVPSSREDCELVSNLYSNRAVTFFREKKFDNCVEDCDKAIAYDPAYDKSWIRKWRALMALGNFDAAYTCLELAAETVGESSRIGIELDKARLEKELITHVRALFEKGEMSDAKEKLRPHALSSDNIGLLFLAARADCGLGHTESALKKVNRALRFNPTHAEGLELRGYALFLSGETEKGGRLLQDVYSRDKDNVEVRLKLSSCQKIHSAFSQGRSCVRRGQYQDAADHFTTAINVSGEVPKGAPLFSTLRTERAGAWLLSKKYMAALEDCYAVTNLDAENATAWAIRDKVLVAMGNADETKDEVKDERVGIRRSQFN
jgi:tetratricopeptide (TPR) repeat protein